MLLSYLDGQLLLATAESEEITGGYFSGVRRLLHNRSRAHVNEYCKADTKIIRCYYRSDNTPRIR